MEVTHGIFEWLKSIHVMQDEHIAKKKKTSNVMTAETTRAILSGHVAYYAACYFLSQKGVSVTQSLVGTPGDVIPQEAVHYNWSTVCEMLATLGVGLSPDHRMLLGNSDPGIINDLLLTMSKKLTLNGTSASSAGARQVARSPSPTKSKKRLDVDGVDPTNRTGAVSVDQGKQRILKRRHKKEGDSDASPSDPQGAATSKFDIFQDLERIRKKREEKLAKQKEQEERAKELELKVKELREKSVGEVKRTLLSEIDITSPPLPCFTEFSNRGAVHFCLEIVNEILKDVQSGEAAKRIQARELEKRKSREIAARRGHDRFLAGGLVTTDRNADHRNVVMCRELVYYIIKLSTLPETKEQLLKKELEQQAALQRAKEIGQRIKFLYEMKQTRPKYDEVKKIDAKLELEERLEREKRYQEMRKKNELRAARESEMLEQQRQEKNIQKKLHEEEEERKKAEMVLYYAEQKAKVLELRRQKAVDDEVRKAKEEEEERALRDQRRQKTIEISKKLMEKEMQREAASHSAGHIPTTLNPVSCGTGQRAGYTGSSLAWQFLTEEERHVAELVASLRADPSEGVSLIDSRLQTIKGQACWFTDQQGKRHPLTLAEGPLVHNGIIEQLQGYKKRKTLFAIHMSIGLTLAARTHACDLAYHGIADPQRYHLGTDGSSATQRIARFGNGLGGPGTTQEIIVSIVRPVELSLSAADIVTFALVDDGCASRENRENLLKSTAASSGANEECCGVGHAIATCGGSTVVEVFVILFCAGTYTDKTVTQMAAAQYHALLATCEPFLNEVRVVCKAVATSKKDLYTGDNVTIGRRTDGPNNELFQRLARDPKKKDKNASPSPIPADGGDTSLQPSVARSGRSSEDLYDGGDLTGQGKKSARKKGKGKTEPMHAEEEEEVDVDGGALKRRLSNYFEKYAPEKLAVVDTAIALAKGREEKMFATLEQKYGPEPTDAEIGEVRRSRSISSLNHESSGKKTSPTMDDTEEAGTHSESAASLASDDEL